MRSWYLVLGLVLTACSVTAPSVHSPPDRPLDGGTTGFVDTVIATSLAGVEQTCVTLLPDCDGSLAAGACSDDSVVLGPKDGQTRMLGDGDAIEVAFRCGAVIEKGGMNAMITHELKIWATVPESGSAVVEVSLDGAKFETLDFLDTSDKEFDLERIHAQVVRYVRIRATGVGVQLDAIEAL